MIRKSPRSGFAIAVVLAAGCTADPPAAPAALVGAWRSSLQFESGAFAPVQDLDLMYVFNAGGTARGQAVRIGS